MLPRETIDSFKTPEGNLLTLVQKGRDFFIELDNEELMSTCRTGSEIALADLACKGLQGVRASRALIGGLGLGFTLRAALKLLPSDGRLVVAELFPEVIEWNRTRVAGIYDGELEDRRLQIVARDIWVEIGRGSWNTIMLDTDNGPAAFCLSQNNRLYGNIGLERIYDALEPGGTLAVWSADAHPETNFVKRMKIVGFDARCEIVREHGDKGHRYAIFVGEKPRAGKKRPARQSTPGKSTPGKNSDKRLGSRRPGKRGPKRR